jgi:hypothetical protein
MRHVPIVVVAVIVGAGIATVATPAANAARTLGRGAPRSSIGGTDLAKKGCAAIRVADAQAVLKKNVTKVVFDPGSAESSPTHTFNCWVNNPALIVTIHPEDASKKTYDRDVKAENVPAVVLRGVGVNAVWAAVSQFSGTYNTAPDIFAHKGAITCEIQGDTQALDISPIPGNLFHQISRVADAAFAVKLGRICNDVFAALG